MKHETDTQKIHQSREYTSYFIFISFIAGLIFAVQSDFELSMGRQLPTFIVISLYIAFSILVSASVFGPILFPLSSFLFGAVIFKAAEGFIEAYLAGTEIDMRFPAIAFAVFPVFFVISVKGTEISKLIIKALGSQSMAAKERYNRNCFPIYAGAVLLLITAFILIEIKA